MGTEENPRRVAADDGHDLRELRSIDLMTEHPGAVERLDDLTFRVRSSSGRGFYRVQRKEGIWTCECGDWEDRHLPCKHMLATARALDPSPPALVDIQVDEPVRRPSQDWSAYDAAQQAEHGLFDSLLWHLLEEVDEPLPAVDKRGRKPIPLRTQLMVAVRKVHLAESCRRARGLIQKLNEGPSGLMARIPNYATPSRLLNRPEITQTLIDLVHRSSEVLVELEDSETVAIDSTGFCTTCMGAYCTEMHDQTRRHMWVKAHVAVGVKTHAILSVRITDEHGADYRQFEPLVRSMTERGLSFSTVCADKAYTGRSNYALAEELGFALYSPFKSRDTPRTTTRHHREISSSRLWRDMYYQFQLHRDEWEARYHPRSNAEAVFSAIKRKLGEPLFSKNPTARINELLAKLLSYNLGVIVHELFEHKIDLGVAGLQYSAPRPRTRAAPKPEPSPGVECDFIVEPVTEYPHAGPEV